MKLFKIMNHIIYLLATDLSLKTHKKSINITEKRIKRLENKLNNYFTIEANEKVKNKFYKSIQY